MTCLFPRIHTAFSQKIRRNEFWRRVLDRLFLDRLDIRPKDWIEELTVKKWMKQILKIEDAEALTLDILYD